MAVPALLHLLAEFPSIRTVMVMVQAEVAERLAAEPGGKEYGVPSVKVALLRQGAPLRHGVADGVLADPARVLGAGAHRPSRGVAVADGRRVPRAGVRVDRHRASAQRRKTSRNAFAEWAGSGNESARRLLAASIDPSRRGETLSVADFVRLLQRSGERDEPKIKAHVEQRQEGDVHVT